MCKLEIFDTNFEFKCSFIIEPESIAIDYLTFDATEILIMGECNVQTGYFAHITGDINFDGIIKDVQTEKNSSKVSIRPLQALFDFDVFVKEFTDVAKFINDSITDYVVNNQDELQNKPVVIVNNTETLNRTLDITSNKVNLLTVLSQALTIYQIAVDCKLDMRTKKVICEINQITHKRVIEADLKNVIEKEITLGQADKNTNKLIIRKIEKDKETDTVSILETVSFFLHTDGTISQVNEKRISPVFWQLEDIELSEDWNDKAKSKAIEVLTPQKFNNEINIKCLISDEIVRPMEIAIGTQVYIIHNKKQYTSILTGKVFEKNMVILNFGNVRVDFTKQLILERRNK